MACGVPALVSDIPVLRETTGGNSLYADPNNPKEWIDVFKSLDDHTTYQSQIEKGLKWIEPLSGTKGWQSHISDLAELLHLT
jgi:glycosyltransferase involved in cell wall biosynthesis